MKILNGLVACFVLLAAGTVYADTLEETFPDLINTMPESEKTALAAIDFQRGKITVGNNLATIDLNENYYFLDVKDARYVLEDLWGNPKGAGTLGMLFPAGETPLGAPWGIEVYFDDIGYVSDKDAGEYDYEEVLGVMRDDIVDANKWRRENGYETLELVGWAAPPHYDAEGRKLHWAKELRFSSSDHNTLNYNIRVLGRRGVLVMNFIAGMDALPAVEQATPEVLAMTNFTEGNRYSDFDPSFDKVAAVGIGGLIAGKVLTKTGFLAVALVFLKKFWFVLLLPFVALKGLFSGRKNEEQ